MDGADSSTTLEVAQLALRIFFESVGPALPLLTFGWLIMRLNRPISSRAAELGREDEIESWDRERRRRYGRHQHKHGRHHRATQPA